MFLVRSVYFNLRNILPKSGTFLPGHPVYISRRKQGEVDTVTVIGFFSFFRAVIRLSAIMVPSLSDIGFVDVWSFMWYLS